MNQLQTQKKSVEVSPPDLSCSDLCDDLASSLTTKHVCIEKKSDYGKTAHANKNFIKRTILPKDIGDEVAWGTLSLAR